MVEILELNDAWLVNVPECSCARAGFPDSCHNCDATVERLRKFVRDGDTPKGRMMAQLALTEIERLSDELQTLRKGLKLRDEIEDLLEAEKLR